jgi:hypothetical protein
VSGSLLVNIVQGLKNLLEVVSADWLREGTLSNKVEQLATSHEFKSHVGNFDLATVRLDLFCGVLEFIELYKVWMFKVFVDIDLLAESLHSLFRVLGVAFIEDLDSELGSGRVGCEFDLGGDTWAESSMTGVLINLRWHFV